MLFPASNHTPITLGMKSIWMSFCEAPGALTPAHLPNFISTTLPLPLPPDALVFLLSQHSQISVPTVRPLYWLFPRPAISFNFAWLLSSRHSGLSLNGTSLERPSWTTQSKVASTLLYHITLILFCAWRFLLRDIFFFV